MPNQYQDVVYFTVGNPPVCSVCGDVIEGTIYSKGAGQPFECGPCSYTLRQALQAITEAIKKPAQVKLQEVLDADGPR